ncbi:MAG TPA: high-potential iron-sulfur protein [Burkholderiales bacterium]|nr:high-potential iron-sulfur protein [Burkholderiales bacterium]
MKLSRRIWLKNVGVGLAVTPWVARSARAQGMASKEAMKYQDKPNDGQRCNDCIQFIAGPRPGANGTCKIVEGPISPSGWCIEFVKKS